MVMMTRATDGSIIVNYGETEMTFENMEVLDEFMENLVDARNNLAEEERTDDDATTT